MEKKQQEVSQLELQLVAAKAHVQGLQESLKVLPREATDGSAPDVLRPGSVMARVREIIREAGKPLHISEILRRLDRPNDKKSRLSVGGSLSGYARKGQIFTRTAPNTFGLLGMDLNKFAVVLPEGFGEEQPEADAG